MKLCPCHKCGPRGASLPKSAAFPDFEPHTSNGWVPEWVCAKCKTRVQMTRSQWSMLPDLTLGDFNRLAKDYKSPQLSELPTKDLIGAGFDRKHAEDLLTAGIHNEHEADPR